MKDWLGNEYDVGDKVLYAAASGRSITMVLAEVVRIFEVPENSWDEDGPKVTKVSVQPLRSSRWEQHSGRTRYLDTRTGKYVDPFRNKKHSVGGYWEHESGERVNDDDAQHHPIFRSIPYWWHDKEEHRPEGWHHVPWDFAPWIEKVETPTGPVTITITKNIVKWVGPDASLPVFLRGMRRANRAPRKDGAREFAQAGMLAMRRAHEAHIQRTGHRP